MKTKQSTFFKIIENTWILKASRRNNHQKPINSGTTRINNVTLLENIIVVKAASKPMKSRKRDLRDFLQNGNHLVANLPKLFPRFDFTYTIRKIGTLSAKTFEIITNPTNTTQSAFAPSFERITNVSKICSCFNFL